MNRPPPGSPTESEDDFEDVPLTWNDLEVSRLSEWHVPTPALRELVQLSETERCVAVVGEPGSGKSATLAALARPELTKGAVPEFFHNAIILLNPSTSLEEFATLLASQLQLTVDGFEDAQYRFCVSTTYEQRAGFDPLFLEVVGPLRLLPGDTVRVAIDGSDQVAPELAAPLREFYNLLATHPALPFLRLIVTERSFENAPPRAHILELPTPEEKSLKRYCSKRGLMANVAAQVAATAGGAWLCAKLAGEMAARDPKVIERWRPAQSANDVCVSALDILAANNPERWRTAERPVLALLAAAGAGPLLPLQLLEEATAGLGRRFETAELRDLLNQLAPFITRAQVDGASERLGVCHQALAEVLLDPDKHATLAIDSTTAHAAILGAIDRLAPLDQLNANDNDECQDYALECEAQHCWGAGLADQIPERFAVRHWPSARQNQICVEAWLPKLDEQFGYTSKSMLALRSLLAHWTQQCGDVQEALTQYTSLCGDLQRVLGRKHPQTLKIRGNIADCTGAIGDAARAVRLFEQLLTDVEQALGADHLEALAIRNQIARWAAESGDASQAIVLLQKLLEDQERLLGRDHPETLQTRNHLIQQKGNAGFQSEALRLSRGQAPEYERLFGKDHPATLLARDNVVFWTGEQGDAKGALQLAQELLTDYTRVLGPDHPDTLTLRSKIAFWTGGAGDAKAALRLFEHLQPDLERTMGPLHPDSLTVRNSVAFWMGVTGDAAGALTVARELIADCQQTLGARHNTTMSLERLVERLEQIERIASPKSAG